MVAVSVCFAVGCSGSLYGVSGDLQSNLQNVKRVGDNIKSFVSGSGLPTTQNITQMPGVPNVDPRIAQAVDLAGIGNVIVSDDKRLKEIELYVDRVSVKYPEQASSNEFLDLRSKRILAKSHYSQYHLALQNGYTGDSQTAKVFQEHFEQAMEDLEGSLKVFSSKYHLESPVAMSDG